MRANVLLLLLGICPWASAFSSLPPAKLPDVLLSPPVIPPLNELPRLSGRISNREQLMQRPRVVIGYVSDGAWAFQEFVTMTHASWRTMSDIHTGAGGGMKMDMLIFTHPKWADSCQQLCHPVDLDKGLDSVFNATQSQCFAVSYVPPPIGIWHNYPFINNVHFFADPRVQRMLKQHYGYAMKTDFDCFLSPTIAHHFPEVFTFGVQEYAIVPATSRRLLKVAGDLGLAHKGKHNLGPTWYGDVGTMIEMANASIPVMFHIITKEFEQLPGGGIAQQWSKGEGWPEWSAGISAMYATEIITNHIMDEFENSERYDVHGDSEEAMDEVYHIHCRHGDKDFSKFDFFQHHYDRVTDLATLDTSIVKDWAMHTAVTTWRELVRVTREAVEGGSSRGGAKSEL